MASLYTSILGSIVTKRYGLKNEKKEIKNEENEKQWGRSMQVALQQQHWWSQSKQNRNPYMIAAALLLPVLPAYRHAPSRGPA